MIAFQRSDRRTSRIPYPRCQGKLRNRRRPQTPHGPELRQRTYSYFKFTYSPPAKTRSLSASLATKGCFRVRVPHYPCHIEQLRAVPNCESCVFYFLVSENLLGAGGVVLLLCGVRLYLFMHRVLAAIVTYIAGRKSQRSFADPKRDPFISFNSPLISFTTFGPQSSFVAV